MTNEMRKLMESISQIEESYFSRLAADLDELVEQNPTLTATQLVSLARERYGQEAATYLSDKFEAEGDLADYMSEAKGRVVEVPNFLSSEDAEDFVRRLGVDDTTDADVVDPETGELLFQPGTTKRKEMKRGAHVKLNKDDFTAGAKLAPMMYGGRNPEEAWETIGELRNSDFYNVVWREVSELVGDPADLGVEGGWDELDYDVSIDIPVAIKRKDGQRLQDDDYENFRELASAYKTVGNISLSMMGTTDNGTVARFTPTFM